MRRMRVAIAGAAVLLLVVSGPVAGAQEEGTGVEELTASISEDVVSVSGTAAFVDVPVVVGEDPEGDSPAPGTDITTLSFARPDPASSELVATMEIANHLPEPVVGTPIIYYNWYVQSEGSVFLLQGNYLAGSNLPSTDPTLRILVCGDDGFCDIVSDVDGTIEEGVVEWAFPDSMIAARPGAGIFQNGEIVSTLGAGVPAVGDVWFVNLGGDSATMDQDYIVPEATIRLGIAPAGTPEGSVPLTAAAAVDAGTGTFDGGLSAPGDPGEYVVVAQACYGSGNCGLASTTITI